MSRPILDDPRLCNSRYIIDPTILVCKIFFFISTRSSLRQHTLHVYVMLETEALQNAKWTFFAPSRQGHDISHTHTLVVAVHLRLAARLDTWLDSSLLCLSMPHMLWTRGENTLQGPGLQNPNPAAYSSVTRSSKTEHLTVRLPQILT